jgi:hypothetical protein
VRRVILESPYAGDVEGNVAYARAALRDCLERGEAPIASHLLYTQPGVLRDDVPEEREWGIAAGLAWSDTFVCEAAVFYVDRGWSNGMKAAKKHHEENGTPCEYRQIPGLGETSLPPSRYVTCKCGADVDTDSRSQCDECGRVVGD